MDVRSGQKCSIESWQSSPLPAEWGLVVLDVPGLKHAVSLGVNHHGLG